MFGEDLIQQLRAVMIGKTDGLCLAFGFQLPQKAELIQLFTDGIVGSVEPVEHVHIKIVHAAPFQLLPENLPALVVGGQLPAGQLAGQTEGASGITGSQRPADAFFAGTAQIGVSRIKINAAQLQKPIHHLIHNGKIDGSLVGFHQSGQPQKSKSGLIHRTGLLFDRDFIIQIGVNSKSIAEKAALHRAELPKTSYSAGFSASFRRS